MTGSRRWPGATACSPAPVRGAALLAATAALLGAGCSQGGDDSQAVDFVQRPESRLIKVQSVGLAAFGPINPATASADDVEAAFGDPAMMVRRGGLCRKRWPGLGLTIDFGGAATDDSCQAAPIERIRVAGRAAAAAGWRTAEGIRPGMPVAAMRRIYPDARRLPSGSLAVVEPPAELDAGDRPVLVVRIARGTVNDLAFPIRAGSR